MTGFNNVVLMGNLTRDPALKELKGGTSVADLSLAVNETHRNQAGEDVETVCFVEISVWGRQAENCAQYLTKGAPVLVEGKLQFDQWETDKGEKRNKLRVRANQVKFIGGSRNGGESQDAAPRKAATGRRPEYAKKDADGMP
jgi:single-strand DNA-binding protein